LKDIHLRYTYIKGNDRKEDKKTGGMRQKKISRITNASVITERWRFN
jgi:hypothetical protein